jgi:hypothetical protein
LIVIGLMHTIHNAQSLLLLRAHVHVHMYLAPHAAAACVRGCVRACMATDEENFGKEKDVNYIVHYRDCMHCFTNVLVHFKPNNGISYRIKYIFFYKLGPTGSFS